MSALRSLTRMARPAAKLAAPLARPMVVPFATVAAPLATRPAPLPAAVAAPSSSSSHNNYDSHQSNRRHHHHRHRNSHSSGASSSHARLFAAGAAAVATGVWVINGEDPAYQAKVRENEPAIRAAIEDLLDGGDYDGHGSYGPSFIRLAWHSSGTYDKESNTGGSNGSTMRFSPESNWGANNGLNLARQRLEAVKEKFPFISYADLWTLAAIVATESMGGPVIPWRPGRSDAAVDTLRALPDGLLPDAAQGAQHVRDVFYRMGFNDQEITALIGAHAVGKTHKKNSGYDGPWTRAPTTFSNQFYVLLKEEKWRVRNWDGPKQYENEGGKDLMMLPADMAFLWDPEFKKWVDVYAADEEKFFQDYSKAYCKLLELGVPAFQKQQKKWFFW